MTRGAVRTDVVILACAISAGIHAALAPEHFAEGVGAGTGFVVSAVLLAALAATLSLRPSEAARAATALVFAGLLAAYALVIVTGVPYLHPERETVEGHLRTALGVPTHRLRGHRVTAQRGSLVRTDDRIR